MYTYINHFTLLYVHTVQLKHNTVVRRPPQHYYNLVSYITETRMTVKTLEIGGKYSTNKIFLYEKIRSLDYFDINLIHSKFEIFEEFKAQAFSVKFLPLQLLGRHRYLQCALP